MNLTPHSLDWHIGTMGFSYQDWIGVFYPVEFSTSIYLRYYSQIFNCVEIDSTFYGTPRKATIRHWYTSTPMGFKFCVKVPRIITHDMSLSNTRELMHAFVEAMLGLEDKLGIILIQLPPSFASDKMERLEHFLIELPKGPRFAVEIRNPSWYQDPLLFEKMLCDYDICWASTDYLGLPACISLITNFIYVRWIGQHGAFKRHNLEIIDRSQEIDKWYSEIKRLPEQITDVYGFFNNDYAGFAAGTALRFKRYAGLPGDLPILPKQGKLFE